MKFFKLHKSQKLLNVIKEGFIYSNLTQLHRQSLISFQKQKSGRSVQSENMSYTCWRRSQSESKTS